MQQARVISRSVLALLAAASLAFFLNSCDRLGGDTEPVVVSPTLEPAAATPVPRAADAGDTDGASGVPELAPVAAAGTISKTIEYFAVDEGLVALPGPWSPDGASLAAFVIADGADPVQPKVRVWVLSVPDDADEEGLEGEAAEPTPPPWDSGDVQDDLERAGGIVAWDATGNLVLPRSDGMRVEVGDGEEQESEALVGQPREILMAPDGRTVLAFGPEGAWIVDGSGRVREVLLPGGESIDAASWRADSSAVALAGRGGAYYAADAATGTVEEIADAPMAPGPSRVPAPRWLADGRVLLSGATWVGHGRQQTLDHRVVDPDDGPSDTVAGMLDLPPSPAVPVDAEQWVSPDGSWLLYPEIVPADGAGAYEHVATWLLGTRRREKIALPPLVDPLWSPDGTRITYRSDGGLSVWHVAEGAKRTLVDGEGLPRGIVALETAEDAPLDEDSSPAQVDALPAGDPADIALSWSPDGRWISYVDPTGALWLVASDGSAGPGLLAERVGAEPPPTWARTSDRLAAAVLDDDGIPRLLAIRVGVEDGSE